MALKINVMVITIFMFMNYVTKNVNCFYFIKTEIEN